MANSLKEKAVEAGQAVADVAKRAGEQIAQGAENAVGYVKSATGMGQSQCCESYSQIKDHMSVVASCGKKVGVVDHVEGNGIKLTRNHSSDGQHHYIPASWVDHVDSEVHLNKNSMETESSWKSDAASCGCSH
ncbi:MULTISPECIES: DUF2171 domain-containing protein [unclassified Schlesneria]|uniref:DUF2171 domain-containing protein n=1 Tax=Schlesneria TaxID=656899 RepID=UPI002F17F681